MPIQLENLLSEGERRKYKKKENTVFKYENKSFDCFFSVTLEIFFALFF